MTLATKSLFSSFWKEAGLNELYRSPVLSEVRLNLMGSSKTKDVRNTSLESVEKMLKLLIQFYRQVLVYFLALSLGFIRENVA